MSPREIGDLATATHVDQIIADESSSLEVTSVDKSPPRAKSVTLNRRLMSAESLRGEPNSIGTTTTRTTTTNVDEFSTGELSNLETKSNSTTLHKERDQQLVDDD